MDGIYLATWICFNGQQIIGETIVFGRFGCVIVRKASKVIEIREYSVHTFVRPSKEHNQDDALNGA